ncbi:MAG: RagB/SusD family nutrient uptake outer membrane protein [Cytophagales bacterium]|nr:RagB/SusD family nutrient uptake outer membrane protein [Cytophagales bacterium]
MKEIIDIIKKSDVKFNKLTSTFSLLLIMILLPACEDFVDIEEPIKELSPSSVFSTDVSASAAVLGIYSDLWDFGYEIAVHTGLSADELINFSSDFIQQQFFLNELAVDNIRVHDLWSGLYKPIFGSNAVLENIGASTDLSEPTRSQLEGEARFMRAFCYLYLVNLFGEVPLITSTDYRVNSVEPRSDINEIYRLITTDLEKAQDLLGDEYLTEERVRVNKYCAKALLARVHLYLENWLDAEILATEVINNNSLYSLNSDLNQSFLANSSEAILQFFPMFPGFNTWEGYQFILTFAPPFNVALTEEFVNTFEVGDSRKNKWIGSVDDISGQTFYFPFKYKIQFSSELEEYPMALGLGEQYLIRAEARAQQDNVSGAQEDLNIIRNRAGLLKTTSSDKVSILLAIEQERSKELFAEWGHRWFDLKRTRRTNVILGAIKSSWKSTDLVYPIPLVEITNNPFLTQNPGYN